MISQNNTTFVLSFSNPVSLSSSYNRTLPTVPASIAFRKSMFANNAQVCYKVGSLGSGVGGVTNARRKMKRT